ncbi:Protein MgtC [Paraburkholderia unamae]|uniref:MgtC/SapB family protein n=1 Tax=Paraburkholderia unamae TaxID=219649 RepID=UPI001CB56B32|nr:MgtC/SapB family protein [Paraburkholderia unamae]CAG9246121.1 Protein MgtC [Paraburkholderia unamae]
MPNEIELIARLLFAALLGGMIGFERERLAFPAGLRTHMLVCVASSLVMIVSAFGFEDTRGMPNVALDPSRVAAQVVSGIGFLGAGAILLRGDMIRGLTTAASVWSVAGIGLAAGGGLYIPATAATVIILVTLTWIKPVSRQLRNRGRLRRALRLRAERGMVTLPELCRVFGDKGPGLRHISVHPDEIDSGNELITIAFSRLSAAEFSTYRALLAGLTGVRQVEEIEV